MWHRIHALRAVAAVIVMTGAASAQPQSDARAVVVNGQALAPETLRALQQAYPVPIAPGHYWYDRISGAWGVEGAPISGQLIAGLALGGELRADASRGNSGVFINGRQVTQPEKSYLEQLCKTPVVPARYWILYSGIGGYEGGPAMFNLGQCPGLARQNSAQRSMSRTYCDGNGNCTSSGILGTITTGGF